MSKLIVDELTKHIDTAFARHAVSPDIMFLVQARDEMDRLDIALEACHVEVERLYKMLNSVRQASIFRVVREPGEDQESA